MRFALQLRFGVSIKGLAKGRFRACKSLHPGSIPGEASNTIKDLTLIQTDWNSLPPVWFL
jgi:hypothetical protein